MEIEIDGVVVRIEKDGAITDDRFKLEKSTNEDYMPTKNNPRTRCQKCAPFFHCLTFPFRAIFSTLGLVIALVMLPPILFFWFAVYIARCKCLRTEPAYMPESYNFQDIDTHTRAMLFLNKAAHTAFRRISMLQVPTPYDGVSPFPAYPVSDDLPFMFMRQEDGVESRPLVFRWFILMAHKFSEFHDSVMRWKDRLQAQRTIHKLYGDYLPPVFTEWKETTTDLALTRFCYQGLAAHRLHRVSARTHRSSSAAATGAAAAVTQSGGPNAPLSDGGVGDVKLDVETTASNAAHEAAAAAEEEVYAVKLNHMAKYPVRAGHELYGADVFFNKDGKPLYIDLQGKKVYPHEGKEWEYAKFVFRSSTICEVTIVDHLLFTHCAMAGTVVTACVKHLAGQHPLRRLLTPFLFRTISVNYAACMSLIPENGIVHRMFALTYPSLIALMKESMKNFGMFLGPPRDHFKTRGVENLSSEIYPHASDALAYWDVVEKFVTEYCSIYWKNLDDLQHDGQFAGFWQHFYENYPQAKEVLPEKFTGLSDVIGLITGFIWVVTGYHQHVGAVGEYTMDPWFLSSRIVKGESAATPQSTFHMCTLASLTAFKMPLVLSPFAEYAHLMLDNDAVQVIAKFEQRLSILSHQIEEANKHRGQVHNTFNPRVLDSSVSV